MGRAGLSIPTDGIITLPGSLLARDAPREEVTGLLTAAGLPTDEVSNGLNVPVLRHGDDLIMFDSGAGRNFPATTGRLPDSMESAGIDPAKVKHVLFTHAHPDHLWGRWTTSTRRPVLMPSIIWLRRNGISGSIPASSRGFPRTVTPSPRAPSGR